MSQASPFARAAALVIAVASLLLMGGSVGYGLGYRAATVDLICKAVEKARPELDCTVI